MLLIPIATSIRCFGIQNNHNGFIHDGMLCSLKTKAALSRGGKIDIMKGNKGEKDWAGNWDGKEGSESGTLLCIGQVQLLVSISLRFPSRKRALSKQPLIEAFTTFQGFITELEWLSVDQAQLQLSNLTMWQQPNITG